MSIIPLHPSEPDEHASLPTRRALRAPTLLTARRGRELLVPIHWSGDDVAHVRILGVAAAHIVDEAGEPVSRLLPGRDYRIGIEPVPATGELVIRLTLDEAPGRPSLTHRLILVARGGVHAVDGMDLAGAVAMG